MTTASYHMPVVSFANIKSSGRTVDLVSTQSVTEMSKGKVILLQARCGPENR